MAPQRQPDPRSQFDFLVRNAAEVIPEEDFRSKLDRAAEQNRPLRVKLGLDPTAADVTLGWAVVLRKLREFQDLGHTAVLIVGDFTAMVGDPSGKSETRPRLPRGAVRGFADRLLGQFGRILRDDRLEVRYNSEWLDMDMEEVLRLTASYTVARMLERDDFATRFAEKRPISVMEFLYPLLQAKDSVAVEADVELGGTDQKFNLLVGRDIQRDYGQEPQAVFTMPLLEGLDGVQKMSQSLGNYVGVTDPPDEMFGKLMSIPDGLIVKYLRLCTPASNEEVAAAEKRLTDGINPMEEKRRLAQRIVELYHGHLAAKQAERTFDRVHRERELPEDIKEVDVAEIAVHPVWQDVDGIPVATLLDLLDLASSRSEARRLIRQGGVRLDGEVVTDAEWRIPAGRLAGTTWQVGRRKFVRLVAGGSG
jgi:tyrosyl-tRNA synthetase